MVPLIVRWPSIVRPGSVSNALVSLMDIFPTFLDILDIEPSALKLDGVSLLPLLHGQQPQAWRDALFDAYDMHAYTRYQGSEDSMRMIRTEAWKLVLHLKHANAHELYDLKRDPGEHENLYGSLAVATKQQSLQRRLHIWMRQNDGTEIRQFTEWKEGTNP